LATDLIPQDDARLPQAAWGALSSVVDAAGGDPGDPQQPGLTAGHGAIPKRHRKTLNQLLGTHIAKTPSDSTFRLLLAQLDVDGFESLLQQWMAAQPGLTATIDSLVCDGKTLRGSIAEHAAGAARFIAQMSLYTNTLGVAVAQSTDATDAGSEIQALRELLDRVELSGLLVQADAVHANRPFSCISSSVEPTC
jgi:hypothetical protein